MLQPVGGDELRGRVFAGSSLNSTVPACRDNLYPKFGPRCLQDAVEVQSDLWQP